MDTYQVSPQEIGPPPEFPNPLPGIGTPSWSMLMQMLTNLEARLNQTISLDIVPEAVLARLYPEFYRLLPFMITAAINLVYWKCSENRLNLLNWESPIVRDVHTKWACYAYVFVLAASTVDYPEHVLEPGESIVV